MLNCSIEVIEQWIRSSTSGETATANVADGLKVEVRKTKKANPSQNSTDNACLALRFVSALMQLRLPMAGGMVLRSFTCRLVLCVYPFLQLSGYLHSVCGGGLEPPTASSPLSAVLDNGILVNFKEN